MEYKGLQLLERDGSFYFMVPASPSEPNPAMGDAAKRGKFLEVNGLEVTEEVGRMDRFTKRRDGRQHLLITDAIKGEATNCLDHEQVFYQPSTQNYFFTTQPYDLKLESYQALEKFCAESWLECSISYVAAWHYPGWTPLIVIGSPGTLPLLSGTEEDEQGNKIEDVYEQHLKALSVEQLETLIGQAISKALGTEFSCHISDLEYDFNKAQMKVDLSKVTKPFNSSS